MNMKYLFKYFSCNTTGPCQYFLVNSMRSQGLIVGFTFCESYFKKRHQNLSGPDYVYPSPIIDIPVSFLFNCYDSYGVLKIEDLRYVSHITFLTLMHDHNIQPQHIKMNFHA